MSMPFEQFRTHTQPVNVADLEARFAAGAEVTPESLRAAGLAKRRHPVKVLGRGELTKKLTVRAHAFSASAKEKIEKAGGAVEVIVVGARDEVPVQASEPAARSEPEPAGSGGEAEQPAE
jgi:large subunit ribosomal protein L15